MGNAGKSNPQSSEGKDVAMAQLVTEMAQLVTELDWQVGNIECD